MGRNGRVGLLLAAIAAIATAAPATAAVISAEGKHGLVTLRTGTEGGDCLQEGSQLVCTDGDRVATASLERGCTKAEGGALCEITMGRHVVTPQDGLEIECESGAKKGYVYLLTDSDGRALCVQNYDGYGNVNGGICFKGRETCTSLNCDHGCEGASLNCGCHIKSRPRQTVSTSD